MTHSLLGTGLVLVGLACAVFSAILGLGAGFRQSLRVRSWVRYSMYGFSAAMVLANLVMVKALLAHDFSVKYVSQVGSRSTPAVYTVVSLWSALEGSILFWGAVLGVYAFAFAYTYRNSHQRFSTISLGVLGVIATFFAVLVAGPANPWTSIPNPALDGPGPNPLLQNHPLMIIHPPMLYLGYVGLAIPFSMAMGALIRGELGDAWLDRLRRWTLIPWTFLSVGIILGGWWAYAVLGWGGYWSWDPVENASLLPWLTATAYLHSAMVLARRRSLKLWTITLCLASFTLTILGTFMTRSGVFNSVHSFTQSSIGPTFLGFITLILLSSLALIASRGHLLLAEERPRALVSREGTILIQNLVFAAFTFVVLLGTLYPLITEGLLGKKITVGEPYFNQMTAPFALALIFLMGVGPRLPWGEPKLGASLKRLAAPGIAAGVALVLSLVLGVRSLTALAAFSLGAFAAVASILEASLPARAATPGHSLEALSRSPRRLGAHLIHLAVVAVAVAVAASRTFEVHSTHTLKPGESVALGDVTVRFDGLSRGAEAHRDWLAADVTIIKRDGTTLVRHGTAAPRMNFYAQSTDPIGTPLVESSLVRDIYISLLAFDSKTGTASFNFWLFPLVAWLWYAIPLLVLGSLLSLWPSFRRTTREAPASAQAAPP